MKPIDREKAWSDFRVGIITFVALSFVVLGISFAGGDKGLFFQPTLSMKAFLADVGGLKKGSPVTMGGMTIGKVTGIAFDTGGTSNQIEVTMQIRSDVRNRIKTDSIPSVKTQGMMGDRYVDITAGSEQAEVLPDSKLLAGSGAAEFDETVRYASEVLDETRKLLEAINEQRGSVGRFFYDERFYQELLEISKELNGLIKDFKKQPRKYIKFSLF
jgi:phospholipid/cholesterol/gamma-HCH transport system substrate-binding protein